MKRNTIDVIKLQNIGRNASFSLLLIFSFLAGEAQKASDSSGTTVACVSYAGYDNDKLFFCLNYENENSKRYTVSITDADGAVLYTGIFADRKFSRVFKVPVVAGNLTFTISDPKNKKEKKFLVSTQTHFSEQYSVIKTKQPED